MTVFENHQKCLISSSMNELTFTLGLLNVMSLERAKRVPLCAFPFIEKLKAFDQMYSFEIRSRLFLVSFLKVVKIERRNRLRY